MAKTLYYITITSLIKKKKLAKSISTKGSTTLQGVSTTDYVKIIRPYSIHMNRSFDVGQIKMFVSLTKQPINRTSHSLVQFFIRNYDFHIRKSL